ALRSRARPAARGARRLAGARPAGRSRGPCPAHRGRLSALRRPVHRAALAVRSTHPMTGAAFDQRNRQVLLAVIAEYVETGEPVGSRAVARRHIQGLSPATIRNAMADLEELGYLVQPHTSAGRVPTDAAYRFYVNSFPPSQASEAPPAAGSMPTRHSGIDGFMEGTSSHLSVVTRLTGLLLAPPLKHTTLVRVELIPLEEDRALAVLVTDAGWVTARA